MLDQDRTQRTYFYELWRAGTAGILETAGTTFLLLIAIRHFGAGAFAKGVVYGGGSLGLMLSPVVVSWVSSVRVPAAVGASWILRSGAVAFLVAAVWHELVVFVVCCVIGAASSAAVIPLVTQMYQENYPPGERGKRFSGTVMIRIASGAIFGFLAGHAMTGHIARFPALLLVFASALGAASFCLARCPSRPITSDGGTHPLRAMRYVGVDRLFRRVLICWMGMGFANLMMLPLRVEYLGSGQYGLSFSEGKIALLTIVIPSLGRLLFSPLWGYWFDRVNFFTMRAVLNIGFAVATLVFFLSPSLWGMVLGAVIYGISNAGGEVAWGLWVTKFAAPERVADYMSVHTFLTGVRGFVAPVLGFYLTAHFYSVPTLAFVASGLIVLSTLPLVPEIGWRRRGEEGRGGGR